MISLPQSDEDVSLGADMTALLDVIFILLVFLLLAVNVAPKVLEVQLPEPGIENTEQPLNDQMLSITVFFDQERDGDHWALNGVEYRNWLAFETALAAAAKDTNQVIVAADKQVPFEQMMKLFSWLERRELSAAQILIK